MVQQLSQQLLFLQRRPKRRSNRPRRLQLRFSQQDWAQQLGSQQALLQQALATQQLGSQQPLLAQQLGSQQPLLQQASATQQLGSQLLQQLLFLQRSRLNKHFRPLNRSLPRRLQHFCSQQLCAQQLGSQHALAAQQLGSQQALSQHALLTQQLGSQQLCTQQLGSQQPLLQWLTVIMRLSSSKAMPWLHIPMLMTSAPNIFHFIAQRLLSMEPGSDASPTNTGDGRAGISSRLALIGEATGWAQRVIGRFWGSLAVTCNLSSLGPVARLPVEPPKLEFISGPLAFPCGAG